jgi:hypothetical protein
VTGRLNALALLLVAVGIFWTWGALLASAAFFCVSAGHTSTVPLLSCKKKSVCCSHGTISWPPDAGVR